MEKEEKGYQNFLIYIRQIHVYMQQLLSLPPGELTMLATIDRFRKTQDRVLANDLVRELSLSRPAVSRMLHVLQKKGLVDLKPNEKDHRCVEVIISQVGDETLKKEYIVCQEVLGQISERFGKERMQQMIEYNSQFCNELAQILSEKI